MFVAAAMVNALRCFEEEQSPKRDNTNVNCSDEYALDKLTVIAKEYAEAYFQR
ncbi:hypothetical protein DPMN_015546 [Dreissena polymorpha]|uniref:Uncharacterized protein n=1 Tax=Dreissena polymorpha TaxID=45954 RepID=A0A9D4NCU7_DREPO|nr:hypothetical protein DPMN_015546 [Dreissena polymorpha]